MTANGGEGDRLDAAVLEARREVVDALANSAEIYGAKPSYGRLYGILYFAREPLSLDELAERSGYAKSTVSTTMSTLERFQLVRRRSIPGEGKRAYYEAEEDLWSACQQFLNQVVRREIETMTRALEQAEAELEASDGDQAAADLERVRSMLDMYEQAELFLELFRQRPPAELQQLGELLAADDEQPI